MFTPEDIFEIHETVTFLDGTHLTKRFDYAPENLGEARQIVLTHYKHLNNLRADGIIIKFSIHPKFA